MDNQLMYLQQISNMTYWELVNMLLKDITPEIRKFILDRLMIMNDELLLHKNRLNTIKNEIQQNKYSGNYEIDIDDIIDDIQKEPDELDLKLARIKKLRDKIIYEKRQRRRQRNE